MKQKLIFSLLLLSILNFSLCSCSRIMGDKTDPDLKRTLLFISSTYLGAVVLGDMRGVKAYTVWADLTKPMGEAKYLQRLHAIQGRWNDEDHPLKGLDLDNISVRTNEASVTFKKIEGKPSGKIVVDLVWNGSAWLVVDDSLFGDGELIAKLTEEDTKR